MSVCIYVYIFNCSESESASESTKVSPDLPITTAAVAPFSSTSTSIAFEDSQPPSQKPPALSKEEQVELARQRYLERKRKLEDK